MSLSCYRIAFLFSPFSIVARISKDYSILRLFFVLLLLLYYMAAFFIMKRLLRFSDTDFIEILILTTNKNLQKIEQKYERKKHRKNAFLQKLANVFCCFSQFYFPFSFFFFYTWPFCTTYLFSFFQFFLFFIL